MTNQLTKSVADRQMISGPYCSCDDFDKGVISFRLEHLVKDMEKLGSDAVPTDILLLAAAVVGAHAKAYGNQTRHGLDDRLLAMLQTSFDEISPALIAMDAANCISMKNTGNGTWDFCFLPPVINDVDRF